MAASKNSSGAKKTVTSATNSRNSKRNAEEPVSSSAAASKSRKLDSSKPTAKITKAARGRPKKTGVTKAKVILTQRATDTLNVYVFGSGDSGVLGLGPRCTTDDVVRPRLNPNLSAASVGVVQIAAGGMHCVALTNDNKILTWGVNDHGALGRDTQWSGGWKEIDGGDDADSDASDGELNPKECTPTAIDGSCFPANTVFTQVAAGDNATFALTEEGLVYGWGTFKVSPSPIAADKKKPLISLSQTSDGALHFSSDTAVQHRPTLIRGLRNITKVTAGSNHALALDQKGRVFSWGFGEQCQLGRRINARFPKSGLVPATFGLRKDIVEIGTGADHSFAVHENGSVFGWGANNYGQTGIDKRDGEEDFANILRPERIHGLGGEEGRVTSISGGNHHSIALTDGGACLTWGRVDTKALGLDIGTLPEDGIVRDAHDKPRILMVATQIPGIDAAQAAAAGSDHCVVVSQEGKAYSWGFGVSGQLGVGGTEDVGLATVIENKAVKEKKLGWAGAGGQYSVLAGTG